MEIYEQGLQLNPTHPGLLNNMAWFYATAKDAQFRNPQKALEYARKAVEGTQEKEPAVLSTLAEAYYANGELDKAIETIHKALSLEPVNLKDYNEQLIKFEQAKRTKVGH